jgi:hypothetical protein
MSSSTSPARPALINIPLTERYHIAHIYQPHVTITKNPTSHYITSNATDYEPQGKSSDYNVHMNPLLIGGHSRNNLPTAVIYAEDSKEPTIPQYTLDYSSNFAAQDYDLSYHKTIQPNFQRGASERSAQPYNPNNLASTVRIDPNYPRSHYKSTFIARRGSPGAPANYIPGESKPNNGYLRNSDYLHATRGQKLDDLTTNKLHYPAYNGRGEVPVITAGAEAKTATGFSRSEKLSSESGLQISADQMKIMPAHDSEYAKYLRKANLTTNEAGHGYQNHNFSGATREFIGPEGYKHKFRTGIDRNQLINEIQRVKRSDPAEFQYQLSGARRYQSTYQLVHGENLAAERQNQAKEGASAQNSSTNSDLSAGESLDGPSLQNGGFSGLYESSAARANNYVASDYSREKLNSTQKATGPQQTGYSVNSKNSLINTNVELQLNQANSGRSNKFSSTFDPSERNNYALSSHSTHQNPIVHQNHIANIPLGVQNNYASSAYTREHKATPGLEHESEIRVRSTVNPITGHTEKQLIKQYRYIHPTVKKQIEVNSIPNIKLNSSVPNRELYL